MHQGISVMELMLHKEVATEFRKTFFDELRVLDYLHLSALAAKIQIVEKKDSNFLYTR